MVRFWQIAAGDNKNKNDFSLWEYFVKNNRICVKYEKVDTDLQKHSFISKEAFDIFLKDKCGSDGLKKNELWKFFQEVQIGDLIIVTRGHSTYLGLGLITSNYQFDNLGFKNYKHFRDIQWVDTEKDEVNNWSHSTTTREIRDSEKGHESIIAFINSKMMKISIKNLQNIHEKIAQNNSLTTEEQDEIMGLEGKLKEQWKLHRYIERDYRLVYEYKKRHVNADTKCAGCLKTCADYYKEIKPINFFELHHLVPLAERKAVESSITQGKDVILLCPNCHTAIHRLLIKNKLKEMSIEDFRKYVQSRRD